MMGNWTRAMAEKLSGSFEVCGSEDEEGNGSVIEKIWLVERFVQLADTSRYCVRLRWWGFIDSDFHE
jgi:hypothetical protein